MLETLISSKTRLKLLLKFFLNSNSTSYLRGLEAEFGDSSNAIRLELNRFENAGMLTSFQDGNKKYFRANIDHPLYNDIHNILLKYIGFDKIVDTILENLGEVKKVYVTGTFANGIDNDRIDLALIGNVNLEYLESLIAKTERHISRRISYQVISFSEYDVHLKPQFEKEALLLWES